MTSEKENFGAYKFSQKMGAKNLWNRSHEKNMDFQYPLVYSLTIIIIGTIFFIYMLLVRTRNLFDHVNFSS